MAELAAERGAPDRAYPALCQRAIACMFGGQAAQVVEFESAGYRSEFI